MNYPLLYVFFIVSACCTCSCYSLNSVYDLMVLTGYMKPIRQMTFGLIRAHVLPQYPFSRKEEKRKRPGGSQPHELLKSRPSIPLPESRLGPRNVWHHSAHDCNLPCTQVWFFCKEDKNYSSQIEDLDIKNLNFRSRKRLVRVEMRKTRNMNQNCRRVWPLPVISHLFTQFCT